MSTARIAAIALIVVGALGIAYGGLGYANDRHEIRVGSMSMTMSDHRTLPVPLWAGVVAVLLGAGLLLVPAVKS